MILDMKKNQTSSVRAVFVSLIICDVIIFDSDKFMQDL